MKKVFISVVLSIICLATFSQNYIWVKEFKGSGQVNPVEVLQDDKGDYYVYGNFNGEIKFDTLTFNAVALQDIFIAKYSTEGNLVWVKFITGSGTENAYGFKFNKQRNAIYLSGVFNSNPINILGTNIWNNGGNDIFLAKIDLDGNLIWAKNVVYGPSHQMGGYFNVDDNNNVIMSGQFLSSVIFYGDEGALVLEPEEPIQRQNFIVKFNEEGIFVWSKMVFSTSDLSYIRNVNTYGNEYYFSGQISGLVKYGNTTIANLPSTYRSGIILKLDANGNLIWSRKIVPNSSDFYAIKHVSDVNGNQYIAGRFSCARIRFDSTATDTSKKLYFNVSPGTNDIYLVKYSRNGQLQWVKLFGGNKDENIINLTSHNNQLIMTGSHGSKMSFGTYTTDYLAQTDAYTIVFDVDGNSLNGLSACGKLNEAGTSTFFSSTNRNFVWIGEYFSDTLRLKHITLINDVSNKRDGFIARFGCFDSIGYEMTKVSCPGANNGSLTAIPSFGNAPYTYLWSTGATTQTITNLPVGSYTVTVTGSNGCTLSRTFSVTQQPLLQASIINVQHNNCYGGSSGSATANPINGTPPYTYKWSNNKTTQTITNLPAGIYTVTIRDACSTTATASVVITQNDKVNATITNTPVTCRGGADGTATAHPIGGLAPYTYKWSNGQTTQTAIGLIANTTYKVTVKDGCNNSVVKSTILSQPDALTGTVTTYASSPCKPTGRAIASASNGTPPYSYYWNTGETTYMIENIPAGTYTVTIKDACGASISISKSVASKNISISRTIKCTTFGQCNGSITVNVTGGDPPYTYLWSNGQTTQTASNLCKGYYKVTVTDVLGCTKISSNYFVPNCKSFTIENDIEPEFSKDNKNIEIQVYPNPTDYKLYIAFPYESIDLDYLIEIFDILGNKIFETSSYQQILLSLDVSPLANGVYFIRISSKEDYLQQKIIIQRE